MNRLNEVVTEAVQDFTTNGFDSEERLTYWMAKIRKAALESMVSEASLQQILKGRLGADYASLIERYGILKNHRGIARFNIDRIRPELRGELDRRIMASANLIKLNRSQSIEKTLQRFSGWATSIPVGGSASVDKVDTKTNIRKSIKQLPFEERRVIIDQSHKLVSAINETVAVGNNALAVVWHSRYRVPNYDYRKDHKERDGNVYALRGNWALERGLMKAGIAGYYDQVTAFGEEVFCRCSGKYLYNLSDLPADMLTEKGKKALAEARAKIS